ncbi:TauD/TfdA family dioxygenase [Kistimonas scapharcae]|uniref:TauD/TfdA family dioxygenase n=1 Tax=Kistimonas scapharcae TaxID=1036133 RepID=A0ABP8VB54_9GAMM
MTDFHVTKHHPRLGVEVCKGNNLNHLNDDQRRELRNALWQHGVIVVRNQHLTANELECFARATFGNQILGGSVNHRLPQTLQNEHVAVLGNPEGPVEKPVEHVACQWHHDKDALPRMDGLPMNALYVVMLHVHDVPYKGLDGHPHTTEFLDQLEAWRKLSPERKAELEPIHLLHQPPVFNPSSKPLPTKSHPLVSEHELIARKGLYMGSDTAIPTGMENDPVAARTFWYALLDEILALCQVYSHRWQTGDVVLWDNSQVMHCGKPYDAMHCRRTGLRLGVIAREEASLRNDAVAQQHT